jgi:hypothetical protein
MAGNLRIDNLGAEHPEPAECSFLVNLDQPRVAGDIGREDRGEAAFDASWPCGLHGASLVPCNSTSTAAQSALSMRCTLGPDPLVFCRLRRVQIPLFSNPKFVAFLTSNLISK